MQAAEDRPSYVVFETRVFEDREATINAGHFVGKELDFAVITPQGSKDRIEREAGPWLEYLKEQVSTDRFPRAWYAAYVDIYKEWKAGREIPETGTPILTWAAINRAQAETILAANIRTVEDLAVANDAALTTIGMGAQSFKQSAIAWLKSAESVGKVASENAALTAKVKSQDETIARLTEKVETHSAKLEKAET
jgi:hypothetical protein